MNINLRNAKLLMSALVLSFIPSGSWAGETGQEESETSHEQHGRHSLGPFIGITREHGHNRETLGIEYSYRITRHWSAGAVIENAEGDKSSTLAIAFVHFWPTEFLYLGLGVGRKDPGDERENTLRGTIGYEFELGGGWAISPQANVDFIEDEETEEVYGLVFGKRF
jgi:hypothetical protein